jgi:hypothetical protein
MRDSAQKAPECRFARDSYNFFLGELLFADLSFVHTLPVPLPPSPIHSLQDDNAIHPLQLGLRATTFSAEPPCHRSHRFNSRSQTTIPVQPYLASV